MDRKLPKLLENHIKSLLEEFSVSNWNLKCGKYNTLTIYWKSDSLSANTDSSNLSQSMFKKKSPSQIRRDQRRSRNWRNNTPVVTDSGYIKSPDKVINNISRESSNLVAEECSGGISIECSKDRENVNTTIVSQDQSSVTSPIDNGIACQLNFDMAPLEHELVMPPLIDTVHTANEMILPSVTETVHEIAPLTERCITHTFEEHTYVPFSKVSVNRDRDYPAPKKYINMKCICNDSNIDIASLFYCKRCYVDLKQYNSDCPLNFNLCEDCCIISDPSCPSCSYYSQE